MSVLSHYLFCDAKLLLFFDTTKQNTKKKLLFVNFYHKNVKLGT